MPRKTNDKNDLMGTDDLPILETPHFDAHEIAQARPVQPLAAPLRQRRWSTPGIIRLVAVIVAGLIINFVLVIAFLNANPLLSLANYDDAASNQIATEQSTPGASQDLSAKDQTDTPNDNQQRKLAIRRTQRLPTIIRFGDDDDRKPKARLVSVIQ